MGQHAVVACCASLRRHGVRITQEDDSRCRFEEWVDPPFPTRAISVINELKDSRDILLRSKIKLSRSVDGKQVKVAHIKQLSTELRTAFDEEKALLQRHMKMCNVLFSLSMVVLLFAVLAACMKLLK